MSGRNAANPFPRHSVTSGRAHEVPLLRAVYASTERTLGRGYRMTHRALSPLLSNEEARLVFDDGSQFAFSVRDPYWSRLASRSFSYEPELAHVLRMVQDTGYSFVDAGANLGFWSVLASSRAFGSRPAIAVEASASTFRGLQRNWELNGRRFGIRQNAIYDRNGARVHLTDGDPASRQIADYAAGESVTTVTLDAVARDADFERGAPLVVKLDVEGAEVAALRGASNLLTADVLLICEEHGSDSQHTMTRHLKNDLGLWVAYVDHRGKVHVIDDIETLARIKTNRFAGYHVVATKSANAFRRRIENCSA